MTPSSASIAMTRPPMKPSMRRLLKNLNVAPSTDSFEPHLHLVLKELCNHVFPHSFRHFGIAQEGNGDSAAPSCRDENVLVVLTYVLVRGPDRFSEFDVEELLHPQTTAHALPEG